MSFEEWAHRKGDVLILPWCRLAWMCEGDGNVKCGDRERELHALLKACWRLLVAADGNPFFLAQAHRWSFADVLVWLRASRQMHACPAIAHTPAHSSHICTLRGALALCVLERMRSRVGTTCTCDRPDVDSGLCGPKNKKTVAVLLDHFLAFHPGRVFLRPHPRLVLPEPHLFCVDSRCHDCHVEDVLLERVRSERDSRCHGDESFHVGVNAL
jgi:hypothetical protein